MTSLRSISLVQRWLLICMAMVALMVLVGGLTRLTESGLSIVKWKLVAGTLPPLTTEAWNAEFAEYQSSPQFKQVNHSFTLEDFKKIFWLEYLHRLLGRVVGLVILLPFLYFTITRAFDRRMFLRGLTMLILVSMQGTVGWIMVASGLQDQPRVAPVKLAMHLSLAFALFLFTLWTYWQLRERPRFANHRLAIPARLLFLLIYVQVVLGALVAGLRAGWSYNTYPLMDGKFIPDGLWLMNPWWKNHLESVLTVQFQHRMLALGVVAAVLAWVAYAWKRTAPALRGPLKFLLLAVGLQFALGVAALLSGVQIALASAHQLCALLLLSASLRLVYDYSTAKNG